MFNLFDNDDTTGFEFLLNQIGSDVTVNSTTPVRAIITNTTLETIYDDKKIAMLAPLQRGDIVLYEGKQYMVISEEAGKRYNKWKGIMRLLPYSITFNSSCVFFDVPAFIETQSFGVQNGQVISLASGQINLNVPNNSATQQIQLNNRFIKQGQAFKVTGIDRYSKPGMVILTCDKDLIDPATDDVVNEIAGGLACTVEITNTEPIEVYEGAVVQLTWNSNNAPVVFASSDESIATVDASGLVTGVSIGQAVITIQNTSRTVISDSVTVSIIEAPKSYSITLTSTSTPITEIKSNTSKTYTANVYNGATLITDGSQPVTWSVYADNQSSSTTLVTITSQSGTSCTLKNNAASSGYVQLRAMLQSDNTVITWLRIQMKALF